MKALIAGNWKMNGLSASIAEIEALIAKFDGAAPADRDVLICPPMTLVAGFASEFSDEAIQIGAQDCHSRTKAARIRAISVLK